MIKKTKRPRRQFVRDTIRNQIITGKLGSGTLLSEIEFAKALNTSRTPIREALMQLEQEGLVEIIPRRGPIVRVPSPPELVDLFLVREALEGLAARLAAKRMSATRLAELREEWEGLQRNLGPSTIDLVFSKAEELHQAIIEGADSPVIIKVLGSIRDRIASARQLYLKPHGQATLARIELSCDEHLEIIKALQARDSDLAERLLKEHLRGLVQDMLNGVTAKWQEAI